MKLISALSTGALAVTLSCDAFRMPQNPSIARHHVVEVFMSAPSMATALPSDNTTTPFPFNGTQDAAISDMGEGPLMPFDDASIKPQLEESLEKFPFVELQAAPRTVIVNTRGTIQQYFPGYIQNLQFTQLLNSYNTFNAPTRAAAETLAAQYNQQARKNTLFNAMTAMANAATAQNQALCNNKKTATVNAIDDFLANVGSFAEEDPGLTMPLYDGMATPTPPEPDVCLPPDNRQVAPRPVIVNTRGTIQQYFPGYIQNLQFSQLLNSYNTFNAPTRAAAETLAAQYNQQARKNTLFNAMTAMANAAMAQNQALCNNKKTATVNAIDDFLANVGS